MHGEKVIMDVLACVNNTYVAIEFIVCMIVVYAEWDKNIAPSIIN